MLKTFDQFVNEGALYKAREKMKVGKMHKVLGLKPEEDITKVYTSGKKLAEDLVKKVGKKSANGMLALAANLNPKYNIFDKAHKALKNIEE